MLARSLTSASAPSMRGGGIFQFLMPRQYFSILLLGIVTISIACLGLRWHVLAQLPDPAYSPVSASPASAQSATAQQSAATPPQEVVSSFPSGAAALNDN